MEPKEPGGRRPYPTGQLLDGKPRAIVFDSDKCIGCRYCIVACPFSVTAGRLGAFGAVEKETAAAAYPGRSS